MRIRRVTVALLASSLVAGGFVLGSLNSSGASDQAARKVAGFGRVVFLSHVNSPSKVPGFPGDPRFYNQTSFTVHDDGYYLQYVHEGEHTGTHFSAPCHFHAGALCAEHLQARDFVLRAVVIDIRAKVRNNPDYAIRIADLKAWRQAHGAFPQNAAVLAYSGCDRWWGPNDDPHARTYYNCGTRGGFHQPGFTRASVRWLIDRGILGRRGALGTDTFGPDPGTDPQYFETWLTLRKHRLTLENLTNLGELPARGAWIVVGSPRNARGSGAPGSIVALIP
jgi:kynurenine formamidase